MIVERSVINDYLNRTGLIILATVDGGIPAVRTMAAFAADLPLIYFATHRHTAKVCQLAANPSVAILFQRERQKLSSFVSITVSGAASRVETEHERQAAIALIGGRNRRFAERELRGELVEQEIFRVCAEEVSVTDFSVAPSPMGVQRFRMSGAGELWPDTDEGSADAKR